MAGNEDVNVFAGLPWLHSQETHFCSGIVDIKAGVIVNIAQYCRSYS
jgi:hypothetical protein